MDKFNPKAFEVQDQESGFNASAFAIPPLEIAEAESTLPLLGEPTGFAQRLAIPSLDPLRIKNPKGAGGIAYNLSLGVTEMVGNTPAFFVALAEDPATVIPETFKAMGEIGEKSLNALRYVGHKATGSDIALGRGAALGSVTKEQLDQWGKDFDHLKERPEEPLMLFLIGTGLVKGTGSLAELSRKSLYEKANSGKLKGSDLRMALGEKPMDMNARIREIDDNVRNYVEYGKTLPEGYTQGVIERSIDRLSKNQDVVKQGKSNLYSRESVVELMENDGTLTGASSQSATEFVREQLKQRGVQVDINKADAEYIYKIEAEDHAAARDALKNKKGSAKEAFVRQLVDASGNIKASLTQLGAAGSEAVMYHDLIKGAPNKAELIFDQSWDRINSAASSVDGKKLSRRETEMLGSHLKHERIIEIEEAVEGRSRDIAITKSQIEALSGQIQSTTDPVLRKELASSLDKAKKRFDVEQGKPLSVSHPHGLKKEGSLKYLEAEPSMLGEKTTQKIRVAAEEYHKAMREQLDNLFNEGLLGKESYDALKEYRKYNPRQFLEFIDPEQPTFGKLISVPDSGIPYLKEGSESALYTNPQYLLAQVVMRNTARIMRNKANLGLLKVAEEMPRNGVVNVLKGNNVPRGTIPVSVVRNGETIRLGLKEEYAKEWVNGSQVLPHNASAIIRNALGTSLVKTFATGINPEFAITNLMRDAAGIWVKTAEYSKHLLVAMAQEALDFATVAKDAALLKGRYTDYINEGGGMEFFSPRSIKVASEFKRYDPAIRALYHTLGKLGNFSETAMRLALRERAIKNGKSPQEATYIARNYMDFAQGGATAKALDLGIPYFNAAIVGMRGVARAAKSDPKLFAYKATQVGLLAYGLTAAAQTKYPKVMESISQRDKDRFFIFPLGGMYRKDPTTGNKDYYWIGIPKDQGVIPITAGFQAAADLEFAGKLPTKKTVFSILDALPAPGLPPLVSVPISYMVNYDFWTDENIWKLDDRRSAWAEYYPDYTPKAFQALGEATKEMGQGISPVRAQRVGQQLFGYRNVYTDMLGAGFNEIYEKLDDDSKEVVTNKTIKDIWFARRFIHTSREGTQYKEEDQRLTREEADRRVLQNNEVDRIARSDAPKEEKKKALKGIIASANKEDKDRLNDRFEKRVKTAGLPSYYFDVLNESIPELKAAKYMSRWAKMDEVERVDFDKALRKAGLYGVKPQEQLRFKRALRELKKEYQEETK